MLDASLDRYIRQFQGFGPSHIVNKHIKRETCVSSVLDRCLEHVGSIFVNLLHKRFQHDFKQLYRNKIIFGKLSESWGCGFEMCPSPDIYLYLSTGVYIYICTHIHTGLYHQTNLKLICNLTLLHINCCFWA